MKMMIVVAGVFVAALCVAANAQQQKVPSSFVNDQGFRVSKAKSKR